MARYAYFDSEQIEPLIVTGWFDTAAGEYLDLPSADNMLELTDAQWDAHWDMKVQYQVVGGQLQPYTSPPPDPQAYYVEKLTIIDRLGTAGKLRAARTALKMGQSDTGLSDAELWLRDRWDAARLILNTDSEVRALLEAIGADPDQVLAAQ